MAQSFWRELIDQDKLEEQYEVLVARGDLTAKEVALNLARFAEARIHNAAERRIAELELSIPPRPTAAVVGLADAREENVTTLAEMGASLDNYLNRDWGDADGDL